MKYRKLLTVLTVMSLFTAAAVFAVEAKNEVPVSKQAGCCARAEKAGKVCDHDCCVEAAKAGNNCEKCKGSGKIEKHVEKAK